MQTLRELQLAFARDIFKGGAERAGCCILPAGLGSARRLQVYRNNMYASLSAALKAVYPVVHRLVGDSFFTHAAKRYVARYPSTSGNLHDFGDRFADFLAAFEPAQSLPYLPDVARLEWAYHRVFHAADAEPLDPMALAGVPEDRYEDLQFKLNPASTLLASEYPILRIWTLDQEDNSGEQIVNLAEGGVRILVLRRIGYDIEFQSLAAGEFALLCALVDEFGFGAACERALAAQPDLDVAAAFRKHVFQGAFTAFSLTEQ